MLSTLDLCQHSVPDIVAVQGVHIHGYEPSALFNEQDPYWEVHNNSRFAPQPHQLTRINSTALLVDGWLYNRTAWLLHSQVGRGGTGSGLAFAARKDAGPMVEGLRGCTCLA
jgi:hypothetical protein